jgi:hypothetical protein
MVVGAVIALGGAVFLASASSQTNNVREDVDWSMGGILAAGGLTLFVLGLVNASEPDEERLLYERGTIFK